MMRLKKIVFALSILTLLYSCDKKNTVKIVVETNSSNPTVFYVERLGFAKSSLIDSAKIKSGIERNTFSLKEINEPTFVIFKFKNKGAITLLVDLKENVSVKINPDDILEYQVNGSNGSLLTKELTLNLSKTKNKLDSLNRKYMTSNDDVIKQRINEEYNAVVDSQRAFSSKFIWANPMSRASVMALYQKYNDQNYIFDRSEDILLFKTVASSLKALYPNSDYTKGMIADIERMQSILSNARINDFIKNAKTTLPEIELPNPKGDTIRLSSLKGKVILLDFWASWNQSSLLDNRELLNIYKQFKTKGFEVFQVSLDYNKEDWINAIESGELPWINVSSLNPNGSIAAVNYNVLQIPANYLIGSNYTIIGKNLYGENLIAELKKIFN